MLVLRVGTKFNTFIQENLHLGTNCVDAAASAEKQRLPEYAMHNPNL